MSRAGGVISFADEEGEALPRLQPEAFIRAFTLLPPKPFATALIQMLSPSAGHWEYTDMNKVNKMPVITEDRGQKSQKHKKAWGLSW